MKARWTTFGLAMPLLVATSSALAGALGVIGDSISVATNADDQCDDAFECVENLGEDSRYSFSVGDGRDGIGLYDPKSGHFYLRNLASSGEADLVVRFGPARARLRPLAGDWDGDGVDGIGVYDRASARFRLRERAEPGAPDHSFRFGPTGARLRPVVGDWNGDGRTGIGVYVPSLRRFLLRQSATGGAAELVHMLPGAGPGGLPLAGRWGGG